MASPQFSVTETELTVGRGRHYAFLEKKHIYLTCWVILSHCDFSVWFCQERKTYIFPLRNQHNKIIHCFRVLHSILRSCPLIFEESLVLVKMCGADLIGAPPPHPLNFLIMTWFESVVSKVSGLKKKKFCLEPLAETLGNFTVKNK